MEDSKTLKNIILSIVSQLITVISGFLIPRLMMDTYGADLNGMVVSIKQFLAYLSLVEAGIGTASITALFYPLANNHRKGINGILSATRNYYRRSGIYFILLVILCAILYPQLVKEQVEPRIAFFMILILSMSTIMELLFLGTHKALLIAAQEHYIILGIQSASTLINIIVVVFLIKIRMPILITQLATTIVYIGRVIAIRVYVKKRFWYISLDVMPDNKAISKKGEVLILDILGMIMGNADIVLLTIFTNLTLVNVYSVYYMVISSFTILLGSFGSSIRSAFGLLFAKGESAILREKYNTFEFLMIVTGTFSYVCISLLILPFISVYVKNPGDISYIRPVTALLFIANGVLQFIKIPADTLVSAAGFFKEIRWRVVVETAIKLLISLVLVERYEIDGVLIGSLCGNLFRTINIVYFASRYIINNSLWLTLKRIMINMSAGMLFILLIRSLGSRKVHSLLEWTGLALLTALLTGIVILAVNGISEKKLRKILVDKLNINKYL